MKIKRAANLRGDITLPGDKSISHRAAMLASIADGTTVISNYAASADCQSTLGCLRGLGVSIEAEGQNVKVHGVGSNKFRAPAKELDCGNSGTTMRLMTGILAGQQFDATLIGDSSLSKRPMKRILEPLSAMGAKIDSTGGCSPLAIHGFPLHGIDYVMPIASAQVKSCVLLAGLQADGKTTVVEPAATRDHTERMLGWFGVDVEREGDRISVNGGQQLKARDVAVPCDISSAAFFAVAAACMPGAHLTMRRVGFNPTRSGIIEVLKQLGVDLVIENSLEVSGEPVADLIVTGRTGPLGGRSNVVRGDIIANLIDEIPILAVLGSQLEFGLEVRDAGELRVKESDRIAAVVENLRRMNADVEEYPDGFRVGRSRLRGSAVDSYGDHRIAMAFAVAGLLADGETTINDSDCVDVSFPGFFDVLSGVVENA